MRNARYACFAGFLILGAGIGLWAVHIPAVKARHNIDEGIVGLALLAIAVGAIVAMPLAGALAARLGSRTASRIGAVLYSIALPLPILAPSVPLLFVAAALFGFAMGLLDVAINSQAVEIERARGRPSMSAFHGFFSIGALGGAAGGGVLIEAGLGDGRGAAIVAAVVFLIALASGPFLLSVAPSGHRAPFFVRPPKGVAGIGVLAGLAYALEGGVTDWSALYLTDTKGASPAAAATGLAVFAGVLALVRLFGDGVVARFGPYRTLIASGLLVAAGIAAALLAPNVPLSAAGFAIAALGVANIVPILFSTAGAIPGIAPAHAMAAVSTLAYSAFLIGPPLIGFAAREFGLGSALALVGVAGLIVTARARIVRRS